ncbi:hypothetical protein ACQCSX_15825 [Pseudarthrobacter sp. P1]|uniref:hypothetical protein n=1 Tax=Pseudarthrobacter sp. P1 TaxID=3418418 RepID=UPI003CE714CC
MAIAVVMDFAGGTLDQYDEVLKRAQFAAEGAGSPGGLFHWVAATDGGVRITDVWESREVADAFYQDQLGPITAELGIVEPEVSYFDVHNFLTAGPSA